MQACRGLGHAPQRAAPDGQGLGCIRVMKGGGLHTGRGAARGNQASLAPCAQPRVAVRRHAVQRAVTSPILETGTGMETLRDRTGSPRPWCRASCLKRHGIWRGGVERMQASLTFCYPDSPAGGCDSRFGIFTQERFSNREIQACRRFAICTRVCKGGDSTVSSLVVR